MPASAGEQAGRHADAVGVERGDLIQRDLVVARDAHVLAQFAEVLHQVVGKRIVVVDHQQHVLLSGEPGPAPLVVSVVGARSDGFVQAVLHLLGRAQHGTGLGFGLGPFGFRIGVGDDAGGGLHIQRAVLITPVRMAMATSISPP